MAVHKSCNKYQKEQMAMEGQNRTNQKIYSTNEEQVRVNHLKYRQDCLKIKGNILKNPKYIDSFPEFRNCSWKHCGPLYMFSVAIYTQG